MRLDARLMTEPDGNLIDLSREAGPIEFDLSPGFLDRLEAGEKVVIRLRTADQFEKLARLAFGHHMGLELGGDGGGGRWRPPICETLHEGHPGGSGSWKFRRKSRRWHGRSRRSGPVPSRRRNSAGSGSSRESIPSGGGRTVTFSASGPPSGPQRLPPCRTPP